MCRQCGGLWDKVKNIFVRPILSGAFPVDLLLHKASCFHFQIRFLVLENKETTCRTGTVLCYSECMENQSLDTSFSQEY